MSNAPTTQAGAAPTSPDAVAVAVRQAARAADAASVRIELAQTPQRLATVSEFLARTWLTPREQSPLATDVLRAIVHADGAVHVIEDGNGIAGASAMIFRSPAESGVYSLIAAAASPGQGAGFALKQAQRAWALDRGATAMTWTFDPLVRRNAYFNLVKLGAVAINYDVDFYGPLLDGIDGPDESDRLTAMWSLTSPRTVAAGEGVRGEIAGPEKSAADLDPRPGPDGEPVAASDDGGRWCRVPADIVALRRAGGQVPAQWRLLVREVMQDAYNAGLVATGITRDGWYRLVPGGRAR